MVACKQIVLLRLGVTMLAYHDHVLEAKGITFIKTSLFYKLYTHTVLFKKKKSHLIMKLRQDQTNECDRQSSKDHTVTATISHNYTD